MNRAKTRKGPNAICKTIHESGQYSWVKKHGKYKVKEKKAYEKAYKLSTLYMKGKLRNPIGSRTYFNVVKLGKKYNTKYKPIRIKRMIFY